MSHGGLGCLRFLSFYCLKYEGLDKGIDSPQLFES